MRYSTASGLMLAAMSIGEAVAGPTHAHLHQRAHEKRVDYSKVDWDNLGVDWAAAYKAGQASKTVAAPAAPAVTGAAFAEKPAAEKPAANKPSTAEKPKATAETPTSSSSNNGLFQGLKGASNDRTSFGGQTAVSGEQGDHYVGNVGNPWGSNIIKVPSASGYAYTNTFKNTQSKSITINIWNKKGSNTEGESVLSGSSRAPTDTALTFVLAPGASQVVAFDENTQAAWAEPCDEKIASGAFATAWGEINVKKDGSGYNLSAINSKGNKYKMSIKSVEAPQCVSDNNNNYWLTDKAPIGTSDGSCYIAQNHVTLTTEMGGL